MTYTIESIKEMLEKLGTEWFATIYEMKNVDGTEYDYADENVWTLSKDPNKVGWENDCNCHKYGLPKAVAEAFASAPSIIRQLVEEVERLENVIDNSLSMFLKDREEALAKELQRLQAENEKLVGRVEELRKMDTLSREIDGEEIQRLKDDLASSEDCTKRVAHQYVHLKEDIERLQSQLAKYERVAGRMIKGCTVKGICGEQVAVYYTTKDWDALQQALSQLEPTKE